MRFDGFVLFATGIAGGLLGCAALLAEVQGVGAVLCALVFALAALCLFSGWRFWSASPVTRYRRRRTRVRRLSLED